MGWSIDTQQLYIGNGTIAEGAPATGVTEILTEYSILDFTNSITSNIALINANVAAVASNVAILQNNASSITKILLPSSSGVIANSMTGNNATITYTLTQANSLQRTGIFKLSRIGSTIVYNDDYNETATSDIVLSATANATNASLNYTTTSYTSFKYQITAQ
jgi:hypothetical protein